MCKIYNINNNKTDDICFYYYIDKIIEIYEKKKINPPQPGPLPFVKI